MATTQNLMLENIRMEYHSFRKDQVLTHKQLNDLVDYFEDQDRLTRTCLTGVGIVCGLKIKHVAGAEPFIELSKGCAVTTDGDLLKVETTAYRHFRSYTNTKKGTVDPIYDPFYPPNNNNKQMDLWELTIPDKDGNLPERSKEFKTFNAETGKNADDLAAILYLEYYLQEPDKCTAIDCDNQGPHQIAAIRLLLLEKTDLDKIINRDPVNEVIYDSIYQKWNNAAQQHNNLPLLKAKRVILNSFNTANPSALKIAYTGILNNESGKLLDAIGQLSDAYRFVFEEENNSAFDIIALKQQLQTIFLKNIKIQQAQYLYDFYKDILDCYNELRDCIYKTIYECCPDKYAFPKHIMLGEVRSSNTEPTAYRHLFYPSPAVTSHKEKLAQCKSMWQRLLRLIENFNIEKLPTAVKVTPSSDYDQPVAKRAIPFYYNNAATLVKNWSYSATNGHNEKNILSYNAASYANGLDSSINPLDYNIDANNFFRIEGHIGRALNQALVDINKIKDAKSLAFDLVVLRIEKNGNIADIDLDDFECLFEDLDTMLQAWLVEQQCLYANVASFFSGFNNRREQGFHSNIALYKAVEKPVVAAAPEITAEIMRLTMGKVIMEPQEKKAKSTALFLKGIHKQDKTVANNLEKSNDALGNEFANLARNPGLSKNDLAATIERIRITDPTISDLTDQEKEVVISTPIRMVAEINELSKFNPQQLTELDDISIEAYKKRSDSFCKYVKLVHDRMGQIFKTPAYKQNGFESYYLFILQEIIAHCCSGKQLEIILKEIVQRKQKILDSLSFTNYAIDHPGMEHKAGVHRGGTFILLYATETRTSKDVILKTERNDEEKLLLERVLKKEDQKGRNTAYDDIESLALYIFKHQGEVDISDEFELYKQVNDIKDGSPREIKDLNLLKKYLQRLAIEFKEEETRELSANMVIADFCLPYLCCSKCPPIAFVVPKQAYNLSLPKAAICNDDELLEFRREPFDGKVTAEGFDSAIIVNGSRVFFDPSKIKAADLGKEIQFKIEGQVTDCRLTVFKHPTAKFEPKVIKDDATELIVEFKNLSDDDTGKLYIYDWNFGDNTPVLRVTNKELITRTYKKAFLESLGLIGAIPVKLTAINGPCSSFAEVSVLYTREEPVSLRLPAAIICNDSDRILFEVQPPNGVVEAINNAPGVVKDGSQFFFDPKLATTFITPISFTVNGKPTNCQVAVFKHPVPKFRTESAFPDPNTLMLTLINETEILPNGGDRFIWEISDGQRISKQDKTAFTVRFDLNVIRTTGNKLSVALRVINAGCEAVSADVAVQLPAPPQATCADTSRDSLKEDVKFFDSPEFIELLRRSTVDLRAIDTNDIRRARELVLANRANANLKNLVKRFTTILDNAVSNTGRFNVEAVRVDLLKQLQALYKNDLLTNSFDANVNKTIIMLLVRSSWKIGLNVIRCEQNLDGISKELMISMLNITQQIPLFVRSMPELNQGNNILLFVRNYESAPAISDATIRNAVKEFQNNVKQNLRP